MGGVPAQGVPARGVPAHGVYLPGGVPARGVPARVVCACQGGTCPGGYLPGGYLPRGYLRGGVPAQVLPPVNRMTDRCKNITLPQTSFAGSKKNFQLINNVTQCKDYKTVFVIYRQSIIRVTLRPST